MHTATEGRTAIVANQTAVESQISIAENRMAVAADRMAAEAAAEIVEAVQKPDSVRLKRKQSPCHKPDNEQRKQVAAAQSENRRKDIDTVP